jgi:hypothetical protein
MKRFQNGLFERIAAFFVLLLSLGFWQGALTPERSVLDLSCTFKNNLIALNLPISEEDTLSFYLDTGGKNYLYRSGRKKLKISASRKNIWSKSGLEKHFEAHQIPLPHLEELRCMKDKSSTFDGMLGREWFAQGVWTFDYKNEKLAYRDSFELRDSSKFQKVGLSFRKNASGKRTTHLPRVEITVGVDTLSMLFDTGAQAQLSVEAQTKLKAGALVATSFINASTFDHWKKEHPQWKVIDGADTSFGDRADMIIVPQVFLGEKVLSDVGFVKRADSNFEVMSEYFMDEPIIGALGANALSQLQVFTIDYPSEMLYFD